MFTVTKVSSLTTDFGSFYHLTWVDTFIRTFRRCPDEVTTL